MIAPGSPTVRRRRLAAELRGIRESKGKSGDAVAAALKWSPSKISRYERARTGLRPREVERLLDYYEITGSHRALLLGLAEDAAQKGWWEEFADTLAEDYQQFIGLSTRPRPSPSGTSTSSRACCKPRATPGTSSAATAGSNRSRRA
jgi:transcriptional regulator with XRE-family HTH domain